MKNYHISQFTQFLLARARQQASWDGKQSTVIEPHYPVYRGKWDLLWRFSAAEVDKICERYSEVVGRVEKRQQHKPRE